MTLRDVVGWLVGSGVPQKRGCASWTFFAGASWFGELIIIVIYPHFQDPALYIHNMIPSIYTGLLLISLLLHVHALKNQCKLY